MEFITIFLKDNFGKIVLSLGLLVLGIFIGIICKSDGKGVFVSAYFPDGQPIFVIGKHKTTISDIKLGQLKQDEVKLLVEKIQKLDPSQPISSELRTMVKSALGPFILIPVNVKLHFIEEENINGIVAKACKNTPVFKNTIIAYDTFENQEKFFDKKKGIMKLHALWEEHSNCDTTAENEIYDVWMSKKYAESWFGAIDTQDASISVKAKITLSGLTI